MNWERMLGVRQRCSSGFAVLNCGVAERADEEGINVAAGRIGVLRLRGAVSRRRLGRMLDCLKVVNLRRGWTFVNTGLWRRHGPRATDRSEVILLPAAATIVATRRADSGWWMLQQTAVMAGGWRNLLVDRTRHGGE